MTPTPSTPAPGNPYRTPTGGLSALSLRRRRKYRLRRRNYAIPLEAEADGAAPSAPPEEEIHRLREELNKAREQAAEAEDRALRARAEVENQRRRHQKDKDDIRKYAAEDVVRDLIQPMDHFALALQSMDTATDIDAVRQGVTMIHRELVGVLQNAGAREVRPNGDMFDPSFHEAVGTEHDPSKPDGHVLEVLRPGWELKGRVLRAAMVKVNKKP